MTARRAFPAALALAALASPASGALSQAQLDGAIARPPAGAHLPGGLAFTDLDGVPRRLAEVAGGRPLVLLFADFTCKHLCGPGLVLTAGALHDAGLRPGTDYRLAVIGLDPRDPPAAARAFAARLDGLPTERRAASLLHGTSTTVAAATGALGYGYLYDPAEDQFAHDASVYVFAADGHLAAALPELGLRPETLRAALAGAAPAPGIAAQVAHLCFGLAGLTGRYDAGVVFGLRAVVVAGLGALAMLLLRRRRRQTRC